MRDAEAVLGIIRERGRQKLPLEDVYRQLFNPNVYLLAYGRIAVNTGALTPGITNETADGMSLKKIQDIITLIRTERYRWMPTRRVYIEKKHSTKKRPLGVSTWSDKLLQEVLRLILEAYYEPQFAPHSHGFRPQRGCHTALTEIQHVWKGVSWFIEGDIAGCFDSLNHDVLLGILKEQIRDNRFIRLIANLLKAGYLEEWTYHATPSGTPQGGVVSPILANIYLDRLDRFVVDNLLPQFTRGTQRRVNPPYGRLAWAAKVARKAGRSKEAQRLRHAQQRLPSYLPTDPAYRRLWYVRYADDLLLGFAGPRVEAEAVKQALGVFLRDTLRLELSETKTLITHGRTEPAHFLGYALEVMHCDTRHTRGQRSINGKIGLKVPREAVLKACKRYTQGEQPIHRAERTKDAVYSIIAAYEAEYRGCVEYYRMAHNLYTFGRLRWIMEESLVKTLAHKLRISVSGVYRRYRAVYQGRKVLQVTVEREGRAPLVARWNSTTLKHEPGIRLGDAPKLVWNMRTEVVERLLAQQCELCGSHEDIEVHHIRALKDLKRPGRAEKPLWVRMLAARQRKKLIVCRVCHVDIQHGHPQRRTKQLHVTGEPDDAKVSRPVRRGAEGNVLA